VDLKGSATALLAGHGDRPAVLLDDAIDDGEAEASPLPHLLRREERLEDPRQHRRIHPRAGAGDGEQRTGPERDPVRAGESVVGFAQGGLDGEPAALLHRVARVGGVCHPAVASFS
jgi:hypothetical protein